MSTLASLLVRSLPEAEDPFGPYKAGREIGRDIRDQQTLADVGARAMKGDYAGARDTAFGRGDLNTGMQVQKFDDQQKQAAQSREGAAYELEKKRSLEAAGIFQNFIDPEQDPAKKAQLTQRFVTSHPAIAPRLQRMGVDVNNPTSVSSFFRAQAQGYKDPADAAKEAADLAAKNAQTGLYGAQADQARAHGRYYDAQTVKEGQKPGFTVKEVGPNQNLVAVGPDMSTREIYRGAPDPTKVAQSEEGLRKEVIAQAKEFTAVRDAASTIEAISRQPSAASDVAMVYSFMKILDPTSVVRESEYATAQNAAGVPDQIRNVFNRVLSGERLSPDQRADFLTQAKTIAQVKGQAYGRIQEHYTNLAGRYGLNPNNVVLDAPGGQPRAAPQGQGQQGGAAPRAQPGYAVPQQGPVAPGEYVWDPASGLVPGGR